MSDTTHPGGSSATAEGITLRRRLSPQDAQFYYLESDQAPMNIGSVAIFEGRISYEAFVRNVESKLDLIPRYRQRAVEAPFNLGRPTWEIDPVFDITRHIRPLRLPWPGTEEQLAGLAAELFRSRLDRRRPLWEMHFVEGLQEDRTALISRVHHCLVDGVGGVELLMVTLDVSPEPSAPPAQRAADPPSEPGRGQLLIDAVLDTLSERVDQWAAVQEWVTDLAFGRYEGSRIGLRALGMTLGYATNPRDKLPFNQAFSGKRKFAFLELPFDELRAVRVNCGGTINDLVLTILAGALGRYARCHAQDVEGAEARVLVPVNVRQESERGTLGNRISMLMVEAPLGIPDPVQRLAVIRERTEALKRERVAEGVSAVSNVLGALPAGLAAALGSLPGVPNVLANLVCTNVPGPMIPLYTVGHKMLAHYPIVPIAWEMGVGCAVMSYNHKLYFGLAADAKAAPDVDRLGGFIRDSYLELLTAAGVQRAEARISEIGPPDAREKARPAAAA